MKKFFSAEELDKLLYELSKELQIQTNGTGKFSLCIVGGGALMLAWGLRRATSDLDVVFNKDTEFVHDCAIRVANRLGVSKGWCNDAVAISSSYTPAIITYCIPYKSYGCLDVYTIDLDLLFCMKLVAGREKDIQDLFFIQSSLAQRGVFVTKALVSDWCTKYYSNFGKRIRLTRNAMNFMETLL